MYPVSRIWDYAVLDDNQPPDLRQSPTTVHFTRQAALLEQDERNRDPNAHFRAVKWNASATARDFSPCCPDA